MAKVHKEYSAKKRMKNSYLLKKWHLDQKYALMLKLYVARMPIEMELKNKIEPFAATIKKYQYL